MAESDAPATSPAPDPLTNDLPGLPIEFRNVRIDETGFHRTATRFRPEAHFTWEQVTAVRGGIFAVVVEGRCEPNGRVRTLARSWASKAQIKRAVDTWKEYRLRVLERDGVLNGTSDHPVMRFAYWFLLACGLFLIGLLVAVILPMAPAVYEMLQEFERLNVPTFEGVLAGEPESLLAWRILALMLGFPAVCLVLAAWLLIVAVAIRRRAQRWKRWEFSNEGFAFWPGAQRRILGPSEKASTAIWWPGGLRIGRESNVALVSAPAAWPLFLALNERVGEGVRWRLAWDMTVAFTVSAMMWALCIWGMATAGPQGKLASGFLMAVVLMATVVSFAMPISMRRMQSRALAAAA